MSERRYRCGVCGKQDTAANMIYSRHTGARYCKDMGACRKRIAGRRRQKVL